MDILSALEALQNASPEALQNHKHETTEALQKIEARLRELDPPEPSSAEQSTSTGQVEIKPSRPAILLTALHTISSWVWKSANSRPGNILRIKRRRIRDIRLDDIRRIEGDNRIERNPKAGPEYKIIRVLAQRSLALQGENSGYLDINSYCKIACSRKPGKANRGRRGKISAFVRAELDVEDEDKDFSIRAISAGIKQLVTERLLKKRLEETGKCNSASGLSAFTALVVRPFRSLTYTEIPEFLDGFLGKDAMNLPDLMENDETECFLPVSTSEVIRVSSAWFDKLQTYYNKLLDVCEDFNQHQPNKRKCTYPNYSLYDHTGSSTELPPFSDRLGTIESSSPNTGEDGSIHCPPTSPQEGLDSLNEVLEHPQSNVSSSPYSTGPGNPRFTSCGLDGSSIQPYADVNPQVPFDPCQNAHATCQAHGRSIQPSNANLAANIRQTDASRVQSNELPNQRSMPPSEERPTRAFYGQIDEPGVINAAVFCPNLVPDAQVPSDSQLSESFNPLDFPNLIPDAQVPSDFQQSESFNPLDFPNLILDTQVPSDFQQSENFNPLNFPNLIPDAQVPSDFQQSESFNPLDFPNLIPDAQVPSDSRLSESFNPLDFPNLIPDAQVPSDFQQSESFNPLDFPNLVPDTQILSDFRHSENFNPLDFPNLVPDTQILSDFRHSENFNPLNFPNLVLDAQLPHGSQISDAFNTPSFPNIALPSHRISVPQRF